jgi:hypothetical protein
MTEGTEFGPDYTDKPSGMTLTVGSAAEAVAGSPLRYRIAKPDGTVLDLSVTEWAGIASLVEQWQAES